MNKQKTLAPVHPNVGLEVAYAKKIEALVDAMHRSIMWWVLREYKANTPHTVMAQDDSTAVKLDKILKRLSRYWQKKFSDASKDMARYFAQQNADRTDKALMHILMESGFAIKFKLTPAVRDVMQSTVKENVALITNMSQRHLSEIQGHVMRSVQIGGDVGGLAKTLEDHYVATRKRARLIAKDQNSKATAALTRIRQNELGITQAKWLHSHAGKEPRPTHVAENGKIYDVRTGWFDPRAEWKKGVGWVGRYVYPGELINCFPAESQIQFAENVEVGYRRWYCGEMSEIITATGKTLRATPNHPVLTSAGWKSIGSLQQGDNVIEIADDRIKHVISKSNTDNCVATISDVFESCSEFGIVQSEVSLSNDFHGDGVSYSYVDIVLTTRSLSIGIESSFIFSTKVVDIVSVRKFKFEGHVFNLQTESGWYVTECIVTHNCRCVSRSIIPELGIR